MPVRTSGSFDVNSASIITNGSSCVSGGYKLEFAAIAFTASTYKRWRERRNSRHKCLSHKSLE